MLKAEPSSNHLPSLCADYSLSKQPIQRQVSAEITNYHFQFKLNTFKLEPSFFPPLSKMIVTFSSSWKRFNWLRLYKRHVDVRNGNVLPRWLIISKCRDREKKKSTIVHNCFLGVVQKRIHFAIQGRYDLYLWCIPGDETFINAAVLASSVVKSSSSTDTFFCLFLCFLPEGRT